MGERQNGGEIDLTKQRRKVLEAYLALACLEEQDPRTALIADLKAIGLIGRVDVNNNGHFPKPPEEPAFYEFKKPGLEIHLDNQRRTVKSSLTGEEKPISGKSYLFLKALMINPTAVLSFRQIGQSVWPEHVASESASEAHNDIKVYVRRIKILLGATEQEPVIHNIKGFGYSLTPRISPANGQ